MEPTILKGDRVLVLKAGTVWPMRGLFTPPYDKPVAYKSPFQPGTYGLLRMAAYSGDTISIDSGTVVTNRELPHIRQFSTGAGEVVPADYSPRDFFRSYRIPGKGELVMINRLSIRDFFFVRSMVQQEHPDVPVTVTPSLFLDDSACGGFRITDFSLYTGSIDSVPDSLRYNWFFWNRMEEYLYQKFESNKVALFFTLRLDGTELTEYRLLNDYYFLLADNRKTGYDSRYGGPVKKPLCIGTTGLVLWSYGNNGGEKSHFRFNRLGKFVR
jgi:signal peptidase I